MREMYVYPKFILNDEFVHGHSPYCGRSAGCQIESKYRIEKIKKT